MSNKAVSVYAEALKREQEVAAEIPVTSNGTRKATPERDHSREEKNKPSRNKTRRLSRDKIRDQSPENETPPSRDLPSRDEIQEFSFQQRDELKVKVQAEVPHLWQKELEETARELNVKKLELYRYIIGEFLGKVQRKPTN
ncbi:hypothetical protein ACFLYO_01575 [Chloroflexota bacterium]